jgi:predicted  nucleic acid-binding Zn-ribbon protein
MARTLVTRRILARELVLNAATRPLTIAVPAGIVVAAFAFAWWLLPIAFVVYAALVVTTVLDGDVAERVGREVYAKARHELPERATTRLTPAVAKKLALAREEEQRIHRAIDESPVPLVDVATEVDRLMEALEKLAPQADRVTVYLAEEDEQDIRDRLERLRGPGTGDHEADQAKAQAVAALQDQLDARAQLSRQLSRFDAQMEHIAATLGAVHAQIVPMSVEEEASEQGRVAGRVRDLRREVGAAADAMQEAYRDLD